MRAEEEATQRVARMVKNVEDNGILNLHKEERLAPYLLSEAFLHTYVEEIEGFGDLTVSEVLGILRPLLKPVREDIKRQKEEAKGRILYE